MGHAHAGDIEYDATVDSLGRITGETFSDISTSSSFKTNSYDYTTHTSRLDERNTTDYTFDTLGKLEYENATYYESDILGNPTNASDDGLSYTLDNEDRIVDVNDVSGDVAAYEYDRLGRRASKIVDGNEIHFVYDLSGNVIAEYGQDQQDTTWEKDYVYGAQGEAVYMRIPQTTEMNDAFDNFVGFIEAWLCNPYCDSNDLAWDYDDSNDINLIDWAAAVDANDFFGAFMTNGRYLLTDFRNSVIGKVNLDGSVDEVSYTAFGEPIISQGTDLEGLSILWNGYYFDDETGNYYLRNRYYSPLERRFLTEDPHGINPDGNWENSFSILKQYNDGYGLQVYTGGDPVNGWDGWGLRRSDCACEQGKHQHVWRRRHELDSIACAVKGGSVTWMDFLREYLKGPGFATHDTFGYVVVVVKYKTKDHYTHRNCCNNKLKQKRKSETKHQKFGDTGTDFVLVKNGIIANPENVKQRCKIRGQEAIRWWNNVEKYKRKCELNNNPDFTFPEE